MHHFLFSHKLRTTLMNVINFVVFFCGFCLFSTPELDASDLHLLSFLLCYHFGAQFWHLWATALYVLAVFLLQTN